MINYRYYRNHWFWGKSINILRPDGLGMIKFGIEKDMPDTAYISSLLVHESSRKQGFASDLLRVAEEEIEKFPEIKNIQLNVSDKNQWLVDWYERKGYIKIDFENNEYIMCKFL